MSSRPTISAKVQLDLFIKQNGICPLCKKRLEVGQPRIVEHTPARALLIANGVENPDDPQYLSIVHKPCAALKTRGCEGESDKHSVAQGDTHTIQKARRRSIARLPKAEIETPVGNDPGFRLKKKMDGSVVRVRTK
jgi:hypothetical protein